MCAPRHPRNLKGAHRCETGAVLNLVWTGSRPSHSWRLSAKGKCHECFSGDLLIKKTLNERYFVTMYTHIHIRATACITYTMYWAQGNKHLYRGSKVCFFYHINSYWLTQDSLADSRQKLGRNTITEQWQRLRLTCTNASGFRATYGLVELQISYCCLKCKKSSKCHVFATYRYGDWRTGHFPTNFL